MTERDSASGHASFAPLTPDPAATASPLPFAAVPDPPAPVGASPGALAATLAPSVARHAPGTPLTPTSLRLSERLLDDPAVSRGGSVLLRQTGVALFAASVAATVVERAFAARYGAPEWLGWPAFGWLLASAALGVALRAAGSLFPPRRALTVPLAPTQAAAWERTKGELGAVRLLTPVAWALAVGSAAAACLVFTSAPPLYRYSGAGAILLVTAGAAVAASALHARHGALRRLYVQDLTLAVLERAGTGGPAHDPRLAPVLRALDSLLGELPEASVRAFLQSPAASAYLALMEEIARGEA